MALEVMRERVIQALCAHYAQDRLTVDELDSRLERAQKASSEGQLSALVIDLPGLPDLPVPGVEHASPPPAAADAGERTAAPRVPAPVDHIAREDSQRLFAIMGAVNRKGSWVPPNEIECVAFWGGINLDFREAILAPVTDVHLTVLMAGAEILVPPGVHVECSGSGIMGAFDETGADEMPPLPGAPVIRVSGFAIMGGVEISYRYPGESARDQKRRLKALKKAKVSRGY
jgi:hypothetical protein